MHVIRLRGSWEISSDGNRTTCSRRFGRPRSLEDGEQVWLVCSHVPGPGAVMLDGAALSSVAEAGPVALDITDHLRPRNRVAFSFEGNGELGEVSIEIRGG